MQGRQAFSVLEGTRVVTFGDDLAGAICAYHLALLGATVYLVEPEDGCWLRRAAVPGTARHVLFDCFGRGSHSVLQAEALAAPAAVWRGVDLVIEPVRGPLAKEGLPVSWLAGEADGPLLLSFKENDGRQLTELTAQAASGMSAFLGRAGEPPYRIGFEIVTYSAAVMAVHAILAALPLKRDHGLGQKIRVPFSRVAANILNNVTTGSAKPDQDVFFSRAWARDPATSIPTADGEFDFLFFGPRAEQEWQGFCARLGMPELAHDERFSSYAGRQDNSSALVATLAKATMQHGRDAVLRMAWDSGAMAVPRYDVAEAARCDQSRANDMVVGAGDALLTAAPWTIDGRRASVSGTPAVGGDTHTFVKALTPA